MLLQHLKVEQVEAIISAANALNAKYPPSTTGIRLSEPIQEVQIQRQGFDLVKRLSMMRIMARRMKAATVLP